MLIAVAATTRRNAPHVQSICAVDHCGISTRTSLANHLRRSKAGNTFARTDGEIAEYLVAALINLPPGPPRVHVPLDARHRTPGLTMTWTSALNSSLPISLCPGPVDNYPALAAADSGNPDSLVNLIEPVVLPTTSAARCHGSIKSAIRCRYLRPVAR